MKRLRFVFLRQTIFLLFLFCTTYTFGQQQRFVWSTVSGSNARVISINAVKSEVMRLYDRHSWMRFERDIDKGVISYGRDRRHL